MATLVDSTEIFRRVIRPADGSLGRDLAAYVASLDFEPADHARYESLSEKARRGELSAAEADELEAFLHVDSLLSILHLKADRSKANAG